MKSYTPLFKKIEHKAPVLGEQPLLMFCDANRQTTPVYQFHPLRSLLTSHCLSIKQKTGAQTSTLKINDNRVCLIPRKTLRFKRSMKGLIDLQSFCDPRATSEDVTEQRKSNVGHRAIHQHVHKDRLKNSRLGSFHQDAVNFQLKKFVPNAFSTSEAVNSSSKSGKACYNHDRGRGTGVEWWVPTPPPPSGWRRMQRVQQVMTIQTANVDSS